MLRYSVLNLPPLLTPPPARELGCGGGDKKCRKSKESPPWVCEKCAKKSQENRNGGRLMGHEMSCGYETPEEVAAREKDAMETSEPTLDLGRGEIGCPVCKAKAAKRKNETSEATLDLSGKHRMDCMSRPPGAPDETSEASLDLGCDKCQKGKKRRQAAAKQFQDSFPSGWLNISGPMLKQVPLAGQMGTEYVYEDTDEPTLDFGMGRMLGQVPLRGMASGGGHGGKSVPYARNYEETDEPTLDLGRRGGMLGRVPLLGDGGRGGRSVPYAQSFDEGYEDYRYCDPSMELCPTPLVGPVGVGIGRTKRCTGRHGYLGQGGQAYGCPAQAPALDPTLNCQRDARGNAVCSNGMYFPPGCPHTPPEQYFSPGIAPDEVHNGILEAKVPAPRAAGSAGADTGGGAASTTNVLPLAAGGIAALGLLYAIFR